MAVSLGQIELGERQQDAAAGHQDQPDHFQLRRNDSLNLNDLDPLDQSHSSTSSERDEDSENEEDPLPGSGEAPTSSLTVREALEGLFSPHALSKMGGSHVIFVNRYAQEKTFRQRLAYLTYNHKIGLFLRILACFAYMTNCILYIAEALINDDFIQRNTSLTEQRCPSRTDPNVNITENWLAIILLEYKPIPLWILQVVLAIFNMCGSAFSMFVRQELYGSIRSSIRHIDVSIAIAIVLGFWYMITLCYPPILHKLFVPGFLFCWPTRSLLLYFIVERTRTSLFSTSSILRNNTVSLLLFLACFLLTCICFFHHFERLGCNVSLFNSYWFIVVTLTTVGFGDIVPSHWITQLLITLFIGIALIYLPPKIEKLWSSFQLHRKLHSDYAKLPNSRHVVLIASSLKPLHLRDFLSEFYSDPDHSDTHCVVMVEQDLPAGIKLLLNQPRWHQRVNILIGSGHKVVDLARAKVRKADACFIRTVWEESSCEVSDHHTIMVAWTVKFYAPHCKLYVHVLRPESRFHLSSMADEVLCESELKQAVLASNCVCPGMSTVAALLMHTFKHEARGFKNPEYQLYEKCSPCEVYHKQLGQSEYFHHFAGKNFLYTAVVAYRKFHVALLGVQRGGSKEILFNPGIGFIMHADDTCFYIGESKEEHHTFEVVKPTTVQLGLWNMAATLASLALHLADVNPEEMHMSEANTEGNVGLGQGNEKSRRRSLVSFGSGDGEGGKVMEEESELDEQLLAERANWQHEAERGLKLLQFHSGHDAEATFRPCVKLNIVPKTSVAMCSLDHAEDDKETCPIDEEEGESRAESQAMLIPHIRFTDSLDREMDGPLESPPKTHHHHHHPHHPHHHHHHHHHEKPKTFKSLLRTLSVEHHHHHHHNEHSPKGSAHELHVHGIHSPKAGSINSGSGSSSCTSNSELSHQLDPMVVLELDNIEEKEELEELEEGNVELVDDEDRPTSSLTPTMGVSGPKSGKCVKGTVSLPYCGSEPIECYLTSAPRQLHEIKIETSVSSDGHSLQWKQRGVLVYCDRPSVELLHFVIPLRTTYHPVSSLRPIILLLGHEPNNEFVTWIAKLPMVYYFVGSLSCTSDLLRAGILQCDYLMVLACSETHHDKDYEHLADAKNITAVHTIARLFPHITITTEIIYRFNIRFLYTTLYDQLALQKMRHLARKGDHLTYLFLPQFVAGKAFTSSMLDTLLYQAYQKPYIVQLFRQLLGCSQVEGSGFIWKYPLNEELLKLKNCGRLFQRLASTHACVPIGIYRSVHFTKPKELDIKGYKPHDIEGLQGFLKGQMDLLDLEEDCPNFSDNQHQQFVFVNPPPEMELHHDDIIMVIHSPIKHTHQCKDEVPCPPDCDSTPPSRYILRESSTEGTNSTPTSPLVMRPSSTPTSPRSHPPSCPTTPKTSQATFSPPPISPLFVTKSSTPPSQPSNIFQL